MKAEQAGMSKHTLLEETIARKDMVIIGADFIRRLYNLIEPSISNIQTTEE